MCLDPLAVFGPVHPLVVLALALRVIDVRSQDRVVLPALLDGRLGFGYLLFVNPKYLGLISKRLRLIRYVIWMI